MRLVAKFQFTTKSDSDAVAQVVNGVLDKWSDRKFDKRRDGSVVIRQSGAPAVFERSADEIDSQRRDTFTILEPIDGGDLQTDIDVLVDAGRIAFRCRISVATDGGIKPTGVSLRASCGRSSASDCPGPSVSRASACSPATFRSMSRTFPNWRN